MVDGSSLPVVAGLAIGIAFVVVFSIFASSAFSGSASEKIGRIIITIDDLKKAYQVGEPVSFTVSADGVSNNLCNNPKPHVRIANADDETVWASPATFSTAIGCINPQGFDLEWRFGYPGEELPYPSGIVGYQPYDNIIMMEKAGSYRMTVEFEDFVVEREFSVAGSTSNEIISLSKGGCLGICHAHAIFIYGNGTAIHKEYDDEGKGIYYIFQIPQNTTAELVQQFYEVDFSSIPKPRLLPDAQHTRISFTDADGKTEALFYVRAPEELRDLDLQIEQLTEKYDDRIIDCTEHSITDCQVHEPAEQELSGADNETGEFETENGVGETIPVDVVDDDSTTIKIEYDEDN